METKQTIMEYLADHIIVLDGGMGTMLQRNGIGAGERGETWNVLHPDIITDIHRQYYDAGSDLVLSNTFGANTLHFSDKELEEILEAGIRNAREAGAKALNPENKFVALDIGPLGRLLEPMGDLAFEEAVEIFGKTVKLGARYQPDVIWIETMNDSYETKAALLAAKENSDLPVFVSNAYSENGKLMTGADPAVMVALLEGMGADAIGVNCSFGPDKLAPVVKEYLKYASVPVLLKPNAGLPRMEGGKTFYDVKPEEFAGIVKTLLEEGVRLTGGCCGTDPDYIRAVRAEVDKITPVPVVSKEYTCITSYASSVFLTDEPVLLGGRINPAVNEELKEDLLAGDTDTIIDEGLDQQDDGAQILDVNVAMDGVDEEEVLEQAVCDLQEVVRVPLRVCAKSPEALEKALRVYNGKALVNCLQSDEEQLREFFRVIRKYGGTAVIPLADKAQEDSGACLEMAESILKTAKETGISRKDIIFDISGTAAQKIREELGVLTADSCLEVSED